jgi:hypothetical protein
MYCEGSRRPTETPQAQAPSFITSAHKSCWIVFETSSVHRRSTESGTD